MSAYSASDGVHRDGKLYSKDLGLFFHIIWASKIFLIHSINGGHSLSLYAWTTSYQLLVSLLPFDNPPIPSPNNLTCGIPVSEDNFSLNLSQSASSPLTLEAFLSYLYYQ